MALSTAAGVKTPLVMPFVQNWRPPGSGKHWRMFT
jgi:hypothetical protein